MSLSWDIRALRNRLLMVPRNDPCPAYFAHSTETLLALHVNPNNIPTIALCLRVVLVFEQLLDTWGTEEIKFKFGEGNDYRDPKGSLAIGLKPPQPTGTAQVVGGIDQS